MIDYSKSDHDPTEMKSFTKSGQQFQILDVCLTVPCVSTQDGISIPQDRL